MSEFELSPGNAMFYRDDDVTPPWERAETIVLLHGYGENSLAWYGWMPYLAPRFRVVRPDMRGFGLSTPAPIDYPWTMDGVVDDFIRLMDHLEIERFHLVGAKIGTAIGLCLAAAHPKRVSTLSLGGPREMCSRVPNRERIVAREAELQRDGVESWGRGSMQDRLGRDCPPEMFEGWVKLMGMTAVSTMVGFVDKVPGIDLLPVLPRVQCPALILLNGSGGSSLVQEAERRAKLFPRAELLQLAGDASYHIAATHARECAEGVVAFIERAGDAGRA